MPKFSTRHSSSRPSGDERALTDLGRRRWTAPGLARVDPVGAFLRRPRDDRREVIRALPVRPLALTNGGDDPLRA